MIIDEVENTNYKPMPQDYLRVKLTTPFIRKTSISPAIDIAIPEGENICECCDFNKLFVLHALATLDDDDPLHNDFASFFFELPISGITLLFTLQKHTGVAWSDVVVLNSTYGTNYPSGIFTDYPEIAGFVMQWQAVLDNFGTGFYRIKTSGVLFDETETLYSPLYCLKEYSQFSADKTLRFQWNNNGIISNSDDDFEDTDFGNTNLPYMIRLEGSFGFASDVDEKIEVSQFSGNALVVDTIRNITNHKYIFKSGRYPDWVHRILKNYAFKSNSLNVSTFSRLDKHTYSNKEIVKEANGYSPNYEHIYNAWFRVEVTFKDKYEDNGFRKFCQASGENCEDVTIVDSAGNFVDSAPSGSTYVVNSGTPTNELTCVELNDTTDGLTLTQRSLIQCVLDINTGQTVSYRTGDDGDVEPGRLIDFFTLGCNNPFGNANRFTDVLGGQTYTNNIVVDWATKLMWYRLPTSGDWNAAIDGAVAATDGGFTDWRVPNRNEATGISYMGAIGHLNYSPFNINIAAAADKIWTSTTSIKNTVTAYTLSDNNDQIEAYPKALTVQYLYCREFIFSDLGF
jgi:hypothetical protein